MVQAAEPKLEGLIAEGNPPQPEAETATPSADPSLGEGQPDYAAQVAQLTEELARERTERQKDIQARRSAEGRLNAGDRRRIIAAERMAARTLSDEDREAVQKETEAALQTAEQEQRVDAEIAEGRQVLQDMASDVGKKFDSDPVFSEARDLYGKGYYLSAMSRMRAVIKAEDAARLQAAKNAEIAKKRTREALDTKTPAPAAASVNVTSDNIDALHMQGKVPDATYRKFLRTGEL